MLRDDATDEGKVQVVGTVRVASTEDLRLTMRFWGTVKIATRKPAVTDATSQEESSFQAPRSNSWSEESQIRV